jgi:superfamily II DNA or RNA helicase
MQAIIADNKWVYVDQIIGSIEPLLIDWFSAKHPRLRFIDTDQQGWDGWYRKFDVRNSRLSLALLNELRRFAKEYKLPFEVDDRRKESRIEPHYYPTMFPNITLADYQMEALKVMHPKVNECGIISVPTGGGKTELMAAVTKAYGLPTVIIADQRVVIEQIKERLELRDVVNHSDGVGLFYGGSRPNGQTVVVGSIQSLTSPPASLKRKDLAQWKKRNTNAKAFQQIVKASGLLLVDECDKSTDKRYRKLFMNYFVGRYKYGFSGTPFDKDKPVAALILKEHMGSVIYEVPRKEVEAAGRIIPVRAVMIGVGNKAGRSDRTAYDIAQRELIIDADAYHQQVKRIVNAFPNDRTLILVDTNNVEDLGKALQEKIEDSIFIYGKTSTKKRKQALMAFQDNELKCLIGGKILKRGLDIKGGVHNLIICGGGKLHSDFDQKVGRAVRKNDRGFARLFCFFHFDNYYLYRHSKEQLKSIINMGYGVKVMIDGIPIEGSELIRRKFRLPKNEKKT